MDFFEQMEARIPHGEVRTRFAPSPTGYMHVGNLRTALYTWLIARRHHGKFILRIEDTDQGRLVEGAVDVIYKTMAECGLDHDEGPDVGGPVGPYIQSERRELFGKYAKLLCEKGGAYYCFCQKSDEDESEAAPGEIKKHVCACRDLPLEEAKKRVGPVNPSSSASASRTRARPPSMTRPSAISPWKTRSWRIRSCSNPTGFPPTTSPTSSTTI